MATGIKDKVVILGMGCSKFGECYDYGPEDLMFEAFQECQQDAGIDAGADRLHPPGGRIAAAGGLVYRQGSVLPPWASWRHDYRFA